MTYKNPELTKKLDSIREKVFSMHDYILGSYYVNMPNMKVGNEQVNDVALFSLMTGLLKKNQLILGNYGLGKTTTSEAVTSLLYKLPGEFVGRTIIQGHPQLTEEKIVGRLDFSKLNETEKVIFSLFAQTPSAKIIDEINRIPEGTQNTMLGFVENGKFQYLNEVVTQPRHAFFATANYKDGGNTDLTPPMLDRFDVSVEVSFPKYLTSYLRGSGIDNYSVKKDLEAIDEKYLTKVFEDKTEEAETERLNAMEKLLRVPNVDKKRAMISDKAIADKIQESLLEKNRPLEEKLKQVEVYSNEFGQQLGNIGLDKTERNAIPYIINTMKFSKDAELYLDSFFDTMNSILKVNGDVSNHNKNYVVGKTQNNLSVRANMRSATQYAKFLGFLKGEEEVSVDTLTQILPYVINHRTEFTDDYKTEVGEFAPNSQQMEKSKQIVKDYTSEEFVKNKAMLTELYDSIRNGYAEDFLAKHPDSDLPIVKQLYHTMKK
ncbi:MAG: MoxR family ATPase [Candidatus Nanoarchaeia archaeon]|nr:MoxR family ATPase [Candidatus Nanoarchaeia archaeon]